MGDSTDSTKPKEDSSTKGEGEVDPHKILPNFEPGAFTPTKYDSEETKKKRKSSLSRSPKKSKGEKEKVSPTKTKSSGASSEGMGFSARRSGRNAPSTSTSVKSQKIKEVKKQINFDLIEKASDEELENGEEKKKNMEDEGKKQQPVEKNLPSEQEQKTDEEKKDANVGDEGKKCDTQEDIPQEQLVHFTTLVEVHQPMEGVAGTAPNTEPQLGEKDDQAVNAAAEEDHNNEPDDEDTKEKTVSTQTLE